jgi:hypothetical protein
LASEVNFARKGNIISNAEKVLGKAQELMVIDHWSMNYGIWQQGLHKRWDMVSRHNVNNTHWVSTSLGLLRLSYGGRYIRTVP